MKYPIGYNRETRTCIFIEEFNGGASFRMWMNGEKVHVEVFTPNMKRRKEKEVGSHVTSLNAYVAEMYAKFNDYSKVEISAGIYFDLYEKYMVGPFPATYNKLIGCVIMDRSNSYANRVGGLVANPKSAPFTFDDILKKFPLGGLMNVSSSGDCNNISHPLTKKMIEDMSEDMIQHINFNSDIKKAKIDSESILGRVFAKTFPTKQDGIIAGLATLNIKSKHSNNAPLLNLLDSKSTDTLNLISLEVCRNRSMLIDAIIWHYRVLNGLIEVPGKEVIPASNLDEVTFASNSKEEIVRVNGNVILIYSNSLTGPVKNDFDFIIDCVISRSKFPQILIEYKDWLTSGDYDQLKESMSKEPPKGLSKLNRMFGMDELDLRKLNTMPRTSITSSNATDEVNKLYKGAESLKGVSGGFVNYYPKVSPLIAKEFNSAIESQVELISEKHKTLADHLPYFYPRQDIMPNLPPITSLNVIEEMGKIHSNPRQDFFEIYSKLEKETTDSVFVDPDHESRDSGFFSGNWLND